jgi:hypothetical protein
MLTYANFQLAYPSSTVVQTTVEMWLNIYKNQLSKYFRFSNLQISQFINIEFCGQDKVFLKNPLTLTNVVVEELNVKTRMLETKIVDTDFRFIIDKFVDQEYIYALDFGCLGCICSCDKLKITGLWGLELPDYIEKLIYDLIETKSLVTVSDPCQEIASEKIGEYQVTYRDTTKKTSTLDVNNVYSIPQLSQLISQIQSHFLYV